MDVESLDFWVDNPQYINHKEEGGGRGGE